jgi:hypothetical protein
VQPTDLPGIDINTERLLTPAQATKHPAFRNPNGRPCHIAKIYRLFDPGHRGTRLESVRVPGGLRTSVEAISRFVSRLTFGDSAPAPMTPSVRKQRERVDAALEAAGIG